MKDVTITLDACQVEMLRTLLNEEIRRYDQALLKKAADQRFRGPAEELETIRDMLSPSESHDPNWYFK